jgi:hypothetical protein
MKYLKAYRESQLTWEFPAHSYGLRIAIYDVATATLNIHSMKEKI